MTLVAVLVAFLLGMCVGSFANVLILRLPESQSVVHPGSRCPSCRRPLVWYENVPVLSYLALRGRCRTCRAPISVQYPLVELAAGVLFAGNFLLLAERDPSTAGLAALADGEWVRGALFTTLLLAIALTDLRTYLIPDELSLGGLGVGIAASFLPGGLTPLQAVLGAIGGGGLLLLVAWLGALVFRKEAMGGGDVKMLAMVGAFVGWQGAFLTVFLGALLGSLLYGPIALYHRLRRPAEEPRAGGEPAADDEASGAEEVRSEEPVDRSLVPFGLFLAPAAALTFYLADELVRGYLRLVGFAD